MEKARNILLSLIVAAVFLGCRDEVRDVVSLPTDPETVPTITSRNVTTLVSDSGITQYRITTKLWLIFSDAKKPFWFFPEGLYLEQFDSNFKTAASIQCDSAKYFESDKLWRLDGNVRIWNVKKELILTNQLFWSQKDQKVYSDSFVHIERVDRILEGYGFVSNERMTSYELQRPSGIFPFDETRHTRQQPPVDSLTDESAPPDTVVIMLLGDSSAVP